MDYYLHSKECYKVKLEHSNYNISNLNQYEIMGLYLLGFIDFCELKQIFNEKTTDCRDTINNVLEAVDRHLYSNSIQSNFAEDIKEDYYE